METLPSGPCAVKAPARAGLKSGRSRSPVRARPEFDPAAEQAFVTAVLTGDVTRMSELIERLTCVKRMLRARNRAMGFPLTPGELDDVEQDTVLTVLRRLGDYRPLAPLESWILGVCAFRLRDAVRNKAKRHRRSVSLETDAVECPMNSVERVMNDWSESESFLRRLGGVEADVVRLKHFEDLTFDQIGVRLGIPANTAKSHYYRGLQRLRDLLG